MAKYSFRLRPGKDSDLIAALDGLPEWQDISALVRLALRLYFRQEKAQPVNLPPVRAEPPTVTADADTELDKLLGGI